MDILVALSLSLRTIFLLWLSVWYNFIRASHISLAIFYPNIWETMWSITVSRVKIIALKFFLLFSTRRVASIGGVTSILEKLRKSFSSSINVIHYFQGMKFNPPSNISSTPRPIDSLSKIWSNTNDKKKTCNPPIVPLHIRFLWDTHNSNSTWDFNSRSGYYLWAKIYSQ